MEKATLRSLLWHRERREEDEDGEREYYSFLHKKEEVEGKMYSFPEVVDDFAKQGIVVILSIGGYFQIASFRGGANGMAATKHKGFRRYITRKGQGHRQSKHAGGKGTAKCRSAGGRLRAFNETKHAEEIDTVLSEWKDEFGRVSRIFLGAPKGRNLDGLRKNDALAPFQAKLRKIPCTMKRPTLKEATRLAELLASFTVTSMEDEKVLEEEDAEHEEEEEEEEDDDEEDDQEEAADPI